MPDRLSPNLGREAAIAVMLEHVRMVRGTMEKSRPIDSPFADGFVGGLLEIEGLIEALVTTVPLGSVA